MTVHVLRLGHRPSRDKRLTTHLILAARAFGASGASYSGKRDSTLEETITDVVSNWGGTFSLEYSGSWRKLISDWEGRVIHLTMYGLPLRKMISPIKKDQSDKLVVVGGAKVPGEIFGFADWNVSVTSQPHSEVSALAIFMHEYFEGRELDIVFEGARMRISSQERGKMLER